LLLVPLALSAVPGDSRLLEYSDNNPFYALSTALTAREDSGLLGFIDKISFHTAVSTTLDLLVWADSANSQSSLFSNFSLCQSPNLEKLPQTEFTFSHVGWTAGMECRSYSQDTGPTRSKRQSVDRRFHHQVTDFSNKDEAEQHGLQMTRYRPPGSCRCCDEDI
jgi:hypothetical protein